jgi:ketosteroid isomerase-like protein
MATMQDTTAIIRRAYEAVNAGDMATLAELFAADAVWHAGGRGRFAGEKRGRDACFAYFGEIVEATDGTFRTEVHDVTASEEHVTGIHTCTGRRGGKELNLKEVLVFHLRDGQIAEAWEHFEDTQAWDAFFD